MYRLIKAKFVCRCPTCNAVIQIGDDIWYNPNGSRSNKTMCVDCYDASQGKKKEPTKEEPLEAPPTPESETKPSAVPQIDEGKVKHLARTIITAVLDDETQGWKQEITTKVQATIEPIARRIAKEIIEDEAKRMLILKLPDGKRVEIKSSHCDTGKLVKRVNARIPTYVWGPRGTGKTHTVLSVLRALGFDDNSIYMESCNPYFTPHDYKGFQNAMGNYTESSLYRFLSAKGQAAFFIDEFDRQRPDAPSVLNGLLAQRHMSFPNGKTLYLTDDKVIVASGNTNMMGGSTAYAAASRQELSTIDRFKFLHWPIDEALERSIASAMSPDYGPRWCNWVQSVRRFVNKPENRAMESISPSPRATFDGLELFVKCEEPAMDVADSVVFKGLDPTMVSKILAACNLPQM